MVVARLSGQLSRRLVLLALLCVAGACRPADACAENGAVCGGDPSGNWVELDACQDPALQDTAVGKRTYRNQPAVTAGAAPPEPTSTDWCADLVYRPSSISLNLPRDTPAVRGAYLTYNSSDTIATADADRRGTYSVFLTSSDRSEIQVSRSCLERFGYSATCAELGVAFAAFGTSLGGVKETSCADGADGGCLCSYLSESDAAGGNLTGTFKSKGGLLTHYAGDMVLPSEVDYCVSPDRAQLTLWGQARSNILDFRGLRTLVFRRVVCGDGVVDRGEQCEPPNQPTCSATCQMIVTP